MPLYIEKRKAIPIILVILIAIEIFYFSSISAVPSTKPESPINLSVIYHAIVFFLFTFFLMASIKNKNKFKIKYLILVFTISLVYAISDEVHQIFVPGRFSDIKDVLIDLIGILFAILIYPKCDKKKR